MDISKWERLFHKAVKKNREKFPQNDKWGVRDRLLSIQSQLGDVGLAVQCKEGIYTGKNKCKKLKSVEHRVAALYADMLLLSSKLGMNTNQELKKVLRWYEKPPNSRKDRKA